MATDVSETLWILAIFIQRSRKRVSLQNQRGETLHNMRGVSGINTSIDERPQSASVRRRHVQCTLSTH